RLLAPTADGDRAAEGPISGRALSTRKVGTEACCLFLRTLRTSLASAGNGGAHPSRRPVPVVDAALLSSSYDAGKAAVKKISVWGGAGTSGAALQARASGKRPGSKGAGGPAGGREA